MHKAMPCGKPAGGGKPPICWKLVCIKHFCNVSGKYYGLLRVKFLKRFQLVDNFLDPVKAKSDKIGVL